MAESAPPGIPPSDLGPIPTTKGVLARLESQIDPQSNELAKRQQAVRTYVEKRVLAPGSLAKRIDMEGVFDNLTAREKADLLYEKLMSRNETIKIMHSGSSPTPDEPIDPYLLSEIEALWSDPQAQQVFLDRYPQARMDERVYRLSELGEQWEQIGKDIIEAETQYREISKELFLQQITRPDKLSSARGKAAHLAQRLIELRRRQQQVVSLEGLPHIPENTDTAAMIMYETLTRYHQESKSFVWLPSRVNLLESIKQSLQNGRWPWLDGEAGTGKSELADAAAVELTGNKPLHIACTSRTNETHLIQSKDIAESGKGGGSYLSYQPLLQAATGYDSSVDTAPSCKTGRIVRFDEAGRLPSDSPAYAIIKEARQLTPGKTWHDNRPVLPGFGAVFTSNPVGPRYPDRHEPDPAMRRELSKIKVDYPPMTADDPELYEFMLATLMDHNQHITVAKDELAPAYLTREVTDGEIFPDGRQVVGQQEIIADPTDTRHGVLYRLSYAVRELQNAFDYGNMSDNDIPETALRYTVTPDGGIRINQPAIDPADPTKHIFSGERLTLSTSTITLGEIASLMKGFNERTLKDDPSFQTQTLTEYLKHKLTIYIEQTDPADREKIRAIFNHFHLFDKAVSITSALPLTPKDIGYLSPRVARPLILSQSAAQQNEGAETTTTKDKPEVEYHDLSLVFEDGQTHLVNPEPFEVEIKSRKMQLKSGRPFILDGQEYIYMGMFENQVVVDMGNGLHRLLDSLQVREKGEFIKLLTEVIFGQDFIGEESIRAMEEQCQQAGIEVKFKTDGIDFPYSLDELEAVDKEKGTPRERFCVLRPSGVKFKDDEGEYDGPITMAVLQRLFKDRNPFGNGRLFFDQTWYHNEDFLNNPLQPRYAMPTKEPLPESIGKRWEEQNALSQPGETRREAVEIMWDTIAYYAATQKKVLSDSWDWSKNSTKQFPFIGSLVFIQFIEKLGISMGKASPISLSTDIGFCPTR